MRSVTLFSGPSGHGIPRTLLEEGDHLRPPVRRGDIDELVRAKHEPGVIVICDGVFHCEPAVSHAEICCAIDHGWEVWGVSSIGAIRAFELRSEGMLGFGYVRSMFDRFPDFTDDELCVLHYPAKPYFPISEALVNVRFALEQTRSFLGVSEKSEALLLSALRELWFGDRTEERMRSIMLERAHFDAASADALLAWIRQHRVKSIDLAAMLTHRPWLRELSPEAQ